VLSVTSSVERKISAFYGCGRHSPRVSARYGSPSFENKYIRLFLEISLVKLRIISY
jgi:hypothetical protein